MNDLELHKRISELEKIDPELARCFHLGRAVAEIALAEFPSGQGPVGFIEWLSVQTIAALRDLLAPRGAADEHIEVALAFVVNAFRQRYAEIMAGQAREPGHA